MQQQAAVHLPDGPAAIAYYQGRYAHGYVNDWSTDKKRRIFEVVRSLDLPHTGSALDFGCGNGVLTDVIRQALPAAWEVHGTDISEIAIENARTRYPKCGFFLHDDCDLLSRKYDLLFTHHVLEHVHDLPQTLDEISAHLKNGGAILHVLPCGNEGSFEHRVCLLRKNGIDRQLGNRFFFEDEGHIRRLTTDQLRGLCRERGLVLTKEYYSGQYYGALHWISRSGPAFIRMFTDASSAVDASARRRLGLMRFGLLALWVCRLPCELFQRLSRQRRKGIRDYTLMALGLLPYAVAWPIDCCVRSRALGEWRQRQAERNGSEMYLVFRGDHDH